jgi:DNA-binding response OmpR family regulator
MKRRRIIIADDSPAIVESIKELLTPYYDVVGVYTGTDVLDLCEANSYDALLIDVVFKRGMSGLDTAAILRERDPHLQIVLMSAIDYSHVTRQKVVDIGATFLEKTIDMQLLRSVLDGGSA